MSHNLYDDPAFFAGYSQLARSREGLAGAPEWPALRAMLPPLEGKRVLDLGCGFGAFSRWVRKMDAADVMCCRMAGIWFYRSNIRCSRRRVTRRGRRVATVRTYGR